MSGWSGDFNILGERQRYSDQNGNSSCTEFPVLTLPRGWVWNGEWAVDKTYTTCDEEGWSYGATYASIESELAKAQSSSVNRMLDFCRRRRWTRVAQRQMGNAEAEDARLDFRTKEEIFGSGYGGGEGSGSGGRSGGGRASQNSVVMGHIGDDDL